MYAVTRTKGYADVGVETSWPRLKLCLDNPRVCMSNDFSELLADLSCNVMLEHVRRNLVFTHGLPRKQVLLLTPGSAEKFIAEFKQDCENFDKVKVEDFPGCEAFVNRSVFQLAAVQQPKGVLQDSGWVETERPSEGYPSVGFAAAWAKALRCETPRPRVIDLVPPLPPSCPVGHL